MSNFAGKLLIFILCINTGGYAALTRKPVHTTLLPGNFLRLNCSTDNTVVPVAWYINSATSSRQYIFFYDSIVEKFKPWYDIDRSSEYDLLARTDNTTAYCGTYECVDNNGGGEKATATVAATTLPRCSVSAAEAESSDPVTYTCDISSLCTAANMHVTMTLQHNDVNVITNTNSVTWTTTADDVTADNTRLYCVADAAQGGSATTDCPLNITIVFAPRSIQVTPRQWAYHPGDRLTCTSEGNPTPSYHWTDLDNTTLTNTPELVISEDMVNMPNITLLCVATNYYKVSDHTTTANITFSVILEETLDDSSVSTTSEGRHTAYKTDYATEHVDVAYKSATIALAIIAIISVALNVLLVIYFLRRTRTKASSDRREERSGTTEAVSNTAYSTLNMTSLGANVVYDSLQTT